MKRINWRKLIEECRMYHRLQCEFEAYQKQEDKLRADIPCMQAILALCNNQQYKSIYDSYMSYPAKITDKNKGRLQKDLENAKNELQTVNETLRKLRHKKESIYDCILYRYLYKVMDSNYEECCKRFYCPKKFVTKENLLYLKVIKSIAFSNAYEMYGEGGYVTGASVIGDLCRKIESLENK